MKQHFNIVLGDYFGEGHGRTEEFHATADAPMEFVLSAHKQIQERTGIDLHSFADTDGDNRLPKDVEQTLLALGYQFENDLKEDEKGLRFEDATLGCDLPEELAAIWVFLLNYVDPDLHCKLEPIPELFGEYGRGGVGYGLF